MDTIRKYPRTPHLEGSRWQPGDEDLDGVPYSSLVGRQIVIEEKLDGANAALSFDSHGQLLLQSRGHYLTGGGRERHFNLFKSWANAHQGKLWELLSDRYLVYGEWLYAKHTVFYDQLPHYFLEFDIFDRQRELFLDTQSRHDLLKESPIQSVPVLWSGKAGPQSPLADLIQPALYKSQNWRESLRKGAEQLQLDPERARRETDDSDLSEGLYIKLEEQGQVLGRYKFVRSSFLTSVVDSETHWLDRPIIPNCLADGVELFV
jgi:hypothetical protein